MSGIYIGLVHYPVLNKNGETIQTAVTNLDIHDIARSASTFGVNKYFLITPDDTQKAYVKKIIAFWQSKTGIEYNSDRSRALDIIEITDSIESCINKITTQEERLPKVITTTARTTARQVSFETIGNLQDLQDPLLILFGTGHGLSNAVHASADYVLEPITGSGDYNHLSVRSAVAIVLDRLYSAVYKGRN